MIFTNELKNFVTSLEQSKKLVKMGIDYKTKFVWYVQLETGDASIRLREKAGNFFDVEKYPAFLSDELWEVHMDDEVPLKNHLVDYITTNKTTESSLNFK